MAHAWFTDRVVVEPTGEITCDNSQSFDCQLTERNQILPWDSDIDVQVTESSMYYLAAYYNMSVFHYRTPRIPEGRDYLLEVNPNYKNRERTDVLNVIDARWIDTESGLFIDITTARYNLTHPAGKGMLSCKDGHEYRVSSVLIFVSNLLTRRRTRTSSL